MGWFSIGTLLEAPATRLLTQPITTDPFPFCVLQPETLTEKFCRTLWKDSFNFIEASKGIWKIFRIFYLPTEPLEKYIFAILLYTRKILGTLKPFMSYTFILETPRHPKRLLDYSKY